MDRFTHEREKGNREERERPPPEPAQPVQAGSLAWASAVGNQAVQRLARQAVEEPEAEEEPPAEVAAMEAAGIGPKEAAALEGLDSLAEDQLPE